MLVAKFARDSETTNFFTAVDHSQLPESVFGIDEYCVWNQLLQSLQILGSEEAYLESNGVAIQSLLFQSIRSRSCRAAEDSVTSISADCMMRV
tara:strand:+ start:314 stop:592 length:279 start_codon:yes stop_codon:yes gene_type:complete